MILFVLAFLGGVLTIISPCILPVLPFVFARADRQFLRSGLPLLAGMAVTFAAFAAVATVGGGWVTGANEYGRIAALVVLAVFGLTLLWPGLADRARAAFRPARRPACRAPADAESNPRVLRLVLLGIATGLLWAPCAGPILGLILTGAALKARADAVPSSCWPMPRALRLR